MFVQVIRGRAKDRSGLRRQWERWDREVKSAADGYLGSTAGIADDGTFIAMVRFESEDAARRNETREAQTRWSQETLRHLDCGVVFHDCTETDTWARGGSDEAGFVQIRQGVSGDPSRLRDLYVNQQPFRMGPLRPEVIGGLFAWHGDGGGFTLSAYFTSEHDARNGENIDEFRSFFDDISAVMQDVDYIDLKGPWMSTR
ncbi:MAG: hypothetical protein ACRDY6_12730 [Acidimicrobiia bacterium]